MTKKTPTNVAASVRARLLQLAKQGGEDFHYVLTRYGLERLLVRLVRSPHRAAFVLKGAMLFRAWSPTLHRPTKDLDLLGRACCIPAAGERCIGRLEVTSSPGSGRRGEPSRRARAVAWSIRWRS